MTTLLKAHCLGLSVKNTGLCPVYSKHSADALWEVVLFGALWPFWFCSDFRAYQVSPGAAFVGKARATVVLAFGFGVREPFQGEGGALSADENPVMGPDEACGPVTIY